MCATAGYGGTPVSGSFQVVQLTLQRGDLVFLLSERTSQLLHLACAAKQPAVLTAAVLIGGL